MWILTNSYLIMNNIELNNRPETVDPWVKVEWNQLNAYIDNNFLDDRKTGKVKITEQNNRLILEQKDPTIVHTSSTVYNENNEAIRRFNVDKSEFLQFLEQKWQEELTTIGQKKILEDLQDQVNTSQNLSNLEEQVKNQAESLENTNKLISEYKKFLEYGNSDLVNKSREWRQTLRDLKRESERRVNILEWIKEDAARPINAEIIGLCEIQLEDFKTAWDEAKLWKRWHVPILPLDKTSIDRNNIRLQNEIILRNKINVALNKMAQSELFVQDQQWLREYLEWAYNGDIDPATHPFYAQNEAAFLALKELNPALYNDILQDRRSSNNNQVADYEQYNQRAGWANCKSWALDKWWNLFSDALVKLWLIDENDTTKKEAWWKFGKVWILALWAFALYKIFTTKGKWRWWWIWWTLWWLLALNNADKIWDWFKDAFGKRNASAQDVAGTYNLPPEIAERHVLPQANTARAIWWIPINTLISGNLIKTSGWKMKIDETKYREYIGGNTQMSNAEKNSHIKAMETLKTNNNLHDALASMWINSVSELQEIAWSDPDMTLVDTDNFSNYFRDLTKPTNADLAREGFKPKDAKSWHKIMKDSPDGKVSNEKIAEWIRAGYLQLNEAKNYNIEDLLDDVDLNNKTMNNFEKSPWQGIPFPTYKELFDAVNLSNKIIDIFKDKPAKTENPFHERFFGLGDIQFDNQNWYVVRSIRWDTNVVRSNPLKNTLKEVSPTLNSNSGFYVEYLNARRKAAGGKVEWQV